MPGCCNCKILAMSQAHKKACKAVHTTLLSKAAQGVSSKKQAPATNTAHDQNMIPLPKQEHIKLASHETWDEAGCHNYTSATMTYSNGYVLQPQIQLAKHSTCYGLGVALSQWRCVLPMKANAASSSGKPHSADLAFVTECNCANRAACHQQHM